MHEVLLPGSAQLVDCPHLLQDGSSCPEPNIPEWGKNPSRGEGQLKKKCIEFQYGNLLGANFHATTFLQ